MLQLMRLEHTFDHTMGQTKSSVNKVTYQRSSATAEMSTMHTMHVWRMQMGRKTLLSMINKYD